MAMEPPVIPDSPPEQHLSFRGEVLAAFDSVTGVIKAAVAPLPTQTGDGSAIQSSKASGLLQDIFHMHPRDIITLAELAKHAATGDPVDDKTFLMERLVQLASELPLTSKKENILNDKFIQQLYDDLQHPPVSFLGDAHRFRAADGSFNVSITGLGGPRIFYDFTSYSSLQKVSLTSWPFTVASEHHAEFPRISWPQPLEPQTHRMLGLCALRLCGQCTSQRLQISLIISWLEIASRLTRPDSQACSFTSLPSLSTVRCLLEVPG